MQGKITEYKLAMGVTPNELVKEVNKLINEGWVPTGGIFITQSPAQERVGDFIKVQTFSHQAMVKLQVF